MPLVLPVLPSYLRVVDSDSIYWPDSLPLPLVNPQILSSPRNEITVMETGRSRTRRHAETLWSIYDVSWNFTDDKFALFRTFFEEELEHGSLPFVIELFGVDTEVRFLEPEYGMARSDNLMAVTAKLCTI